MRYGLRLPLVLCATILLGVACDSFSDPTTGDLRVSVATSGGDVDLNGYAVLVDGVERTTIGVNGVAVVRSLPTGSHDVTLSDVAPNCTMGTTSIGAIVNGGKTTNMDFTVACVASGVRVTTTTTGIDLDVDGYAVAVDGVAAGVVGVNGSVQVTRLAPGTHTVTLNGAATNCGVGGDNPRSITVASGEIVAVGFGVACAAVTGIVEIRASTTGLDLDANGYTVRLNGGVPSPLTINGVVRFPGLAAGDYSIALDSASNNCTVGGTNPRSLSVTAGGAKRDTARTTFEVSCRAVTGVIEVSAATSGVEMDADGYTVRVDGVGVQVLGINGTVRFTGVAVGSHTIRLEGVAGNCSVADTPRAVDVTAGGITRDTARTTFQVTCLAYGSLRIVTTTSGAEIDPDGYQVVVDESCDPSGYYCNYAWAGALGTNDAVTIPNLALGPHAVQLSGVARNCILAGENPRATRTDPGVTTEAAFAITCAQTARVQVTLTTSGVDPDVNGYDVTLDGAVFDTSTTIGSNATVTIANLVAGDYRVTISRMDLNCNVAGLNPRTVSAVGGSTVPVGFDVTCTAVGQLALVSNGDGNDEIYLVKANGTSLTRLTTNVASDADPTWSPDGSKIAFRSNRAGSADIYVMNADGSSPIRLTTVSAADYQPSWSPDGTRIAFTSGRDGNPEIYVMNANGSNPVRLTTDGATPTTDADPAWSPDGTKIAFWSERDGVAEIYVMNPDGSNPVRVTTSGGNDQPAWSPDGVKLAFRHQVCSYYYYYYCEYHLFVVNADGSGPAPLTSGYRDDADPDWSRDGAWIAFSTAYCDGYYNCITVVKPNGTDYSRILIGPYVQPVWRP
jgi:hypothetical protein